MKKFKNLKNVSEFYRIDHKKLKNEQLSDMYMQFMSRFYPPPKELSIPKIVEILRMKVQIESEIERREASGELK